MAECSTDFNCTEKAHFGCLRGMCQRIEGIKPNTCIVSPDNCPPEHHICQQGSCITTTATNITEDNCNPLKNNDDCIASGISLPINQQAAEELKSQGVIFSSSGDCKNAEGKSVSAQTNLKEMLNAEPLTVCNAECKTNGNPCVQTNITADGDMMFKLTQVRKSGKQFNVNSITTGEHKANSDHYKGKAVDLSAVGGTTYLELEAAFEKKLFNGIELVQCESKRKVVPCGSSEVDHLHVSYN